MGVVLTLESKENLKTWAESPEHLRFGVSLVAYLVLTLTFSRLHALRESICEDSLAYDIEF